MNIQIFIPRLCLVDEDAPSHTVLEHLLAAGNHVWHLESLEAMLCQLAGIQKQADWPIASLGSLGEGLEPGDDYWLCADPVHYVLQRDSFSLSGLIALSKSDAHTLAGAINEHFAPEGLEFCVADSGRWYLRLNENPEITTTLLATAMGRDINIYLPQGMGAAKWNRLQNEMQMLLFTHPLNQARETEGKPTVNSLWLSGGGELPAKTETDLRIAFTNNALIKGLGLTGNFPCSPLPENLGGLPDEGSDNIWLELDNLDGAEQKWFAPALAGLRKGKIRKLTLHFASYDRTLSVDIRPRDLWRFWRKTRPLKAYLP